MANLSAEPGCWDTDWLDPEDGVGKPVGRLICPPQDDVDTTTTNNDSTAQGRNGDNCKGVQQDMHVFISHTGKDGVKEDIARPTKWFLKTILQVQNIFVDDGSTEWGDDKHLALSKPAFSCTHALVLLSPTFRQREFCVLELNTFMERWRCFMSDDAGTGSFRILVALWKLSHTEGYHPEVNNSIRKAQDTTSPIYFMLQTLWPDLEEVLLVQGSQHLSTTRNPEEQYRQLQEYFLAYVTENMGGPKGMPSDFLRHAIDHGALTPSPVGYSPDKRIVGVAFSRVNLDENISWSEHVKARKKNIEAILNSISKHGKVTHGRGIVQIQRKGCLGLFGAAVVRLECDIEISVEICDVELQMIRTALDSLANMLETEGVSKDDVEKMIIGNVWKGSLQVLLEAPDAALESMFRLLFGAPGRRLEVGRGVFFTDLMPAFTLQADLQHPPPSIDDGDTVVLWQMEGFDLLFPTSALARGKLFAGGLSLEQWRTTEATFDSTMAHVSKTIRDLNGTSTEVATSIPAANSLSNEAVTRQPLSPMEPDGQDLEKAMELYQQAARQGHLEAIFNLGMCYQNGTGVEQDLVKAVEWYQQAASQGHLEATFNLGKCYQDGTGVEQDSAKAVEWYQQAASQGHLEATFNLGKCYQDGTGHQGPEDTHDNSWALPSMQIYRHAAIPSMDSHVAEVWKSVSLERPFDVFLCHTGAQRNLAGVMKDFLENGGLRCFLDADLRPADGPPVETMATALETARYVVVILSKDFLRKVDPLVELVYAFERMQWLRARGDWMSLYVILYDLTVSEYQRFQAFEATTADGSHARLVSLPPLSSELILREARSTSSWRDVCLQLKADLINHDKEKAVESWMGFLEKWGSHHDETFPRAQHLYSRDSPFSSSAALYAEKLVFGVAFSRVYMDENSAWNSKVWERKSHIEANLEQISRHGTLIDGVSTMYRERGCFGFFVGPAKVRLECTIELANHESLSEGDLKDVRQAAAAIVDHLKECGASESEVRNMIIGNLWRG